MSAHRGLVPDNSCGRCWYCDEPVFPGGSAEALRDADCASTRDHVNPQRLKEWLGPGGKARGDGEGGAVNAFSFLSVCSGIEAASAAWEPLGWRPALYSEIEDFPRRVLAFRNAAVPAQRWRRGTNGVPLWGDFTALRPRHLRRLGVALPNVLVGGTPCQAFSFAGRRKSLADARGNLTLAFARLAHALTAARTAAGLSGLIVVWENVPGVLSTPDNAFGCFLGELVGAGDALRVPDGARWPDAGLASGPRARLAWRILDAQHFGLAQRRRRVFVVVDLGGSGIDPAAVLLEPRSLPGNPPAGVEARQDVAGMVAGGARRHGDYSADDSQLTAQGNEPWTLAERGRGGSPSLEFRQDGLANTLLTPNGGRSGLGVGAVAVAFDARQSDVAIYGDQAGTLDTDGYSIAVAYGGGRTSGPLDVAATLTANGGGQAMDFEVETLVTHTLRGEGFDASEDGTGRGVPLVQVAFDTTQITSPHNRSPAVPGSPCHPLAARAHAPAIAFSSKDHGADAGEIAPTLRAGAHRESNANAGVPPAVASGASVRRLTPRECERLMGFPDDHTRIPERLYPRRRITALRPADMWEPHPVAGWWLMSADGPRYRALGNSKAVPVVRWIGERIEAQRKSAFAEAAE